MIIEGAVPQPKIFPGVFHERNRRGSVRQGSISEKDFEACSTASAAGGAARPGSSGQDAKGVHETVAEEPAEQEQSSGTNK